jgi:kumamolisin
MAKAKKPNGPAQPAAKAPLPGSGRRPRPTFKEVRPAQPDDPVQVVIKVRPKNEIPDPEILGAMLPTQRPPRENYAEHVAEHGADPADVAKVVDFARQHNLQVVESSPAQRMVILKGAVKDMNTAFGVQLNIFHSAVTGASYRGREGEVQLPDALRDVVTAVAGLDNRKQVKRGGEAVAKGSAKRRAKGPARDTAPGTAHAVHQVGYKPTELASFYNFPPDLDGTGQCIGLLEFDGGYKTEDLKAYFAWLGIPAPQVVAVSADGTQNNPGSDADGEVVLDIDVAGAAAPGARIAVYFAQFTEAGWVAALTKAVHDTVNRPSVISISWGFGEFEDAGTLAWTPAVMEEVNRTLKEAANLGVTVIVASGDDGSIDGFKDDGRAHVDFPASSPYVLACGGTMIEVKDGKITSEVVWSNGVRGDRPLGGSTGGGISDHFPIPNWQANSPARVPQTINPSHFAGRGVPDVAAVADARSGYWMLLDGEKIINGGTSASAPLWAALIARINQKLKDLPGSGSVGYFNPLLYKQLGQTAAFNDITDGTNDALGNLNGAYTAGPGWDACTGWGSPNGVNLLNALTGGAAAPDHAPPAKPHAHGRKH